MKITMNEEKAKEIYELTNYNVTVRSAEKLLESNYIEGDDKLFEVELLIKKSKSVYNPMDDLQEGDQLQHNVLGTCETFTITKKTAKRMTARRDSVDSQGNITHNPNGYEVNLSKRKDNEWAVLGNHFHEGSWTIYKD